ncbi:MAG: undecaprenyl/decaprenyl-phosphate alpha-N-acetylglucosaminyl 1-phosphate transferase [Cellulomonas iranensis]|uniref:MraY family glycosyltransferase n=1 Tax=Cellulomonas TaxID=1707 RepID=UPI001070A8C2|nr:MULTISPECIES: MraY family glycosyltransferase [Cellulomonas]MBO9569103.1 undecaprenyl/decaprenyl-phosphate alpha-N-acetylglucosaminyl 1-phosphate transferase [Cellulomonas iranensis]TFH70397.1 undecaprenyl/decaprenyl-phosphate alpha-N-acetylglucosaminyl 1-phosphate transferase [Cellulomonas sp. HD19AZ1]
MRVYLLVAVVAAVVTYLTTPLARWCALRWGAITAVRDRDVHAVPTPRLGGMAMFVGLLVALLIGSRVPFLEPVYANPRPIFGIVGGAAIVCALGVADDIWDLDWLTKLMGQILAAGFLAWQGVLLYQLPVAENVISGSSRSAVFLTVVSVVVAMNAVNFVDGLDGLAAGVLAIGGAAFFVYAYLLTIGTGRDDYSNLATLVVAALVGVCVGFLPHNFYPARIFMGDSGSMLLGFVIAAAAIVVTGQIDFAAVVDRVRFPAYVPILLPVAVLVLPLLDMGLAIVRRLLNGKSPFHPDRLHLHHRLLALGHSHRRAVAIMYVWTGVLAFGVAALAALSTTTVLVLTGTGVVIATILTFGPLRGSRRTPDDVPDDAPTVVGS